MIRTDKRLRICSVLLVANLAFIWGNSLLPGEISGAFSDWGKNLIAALFPYEGPAQESGGLIRKIAHFTEFACLGMCLSWLLGMLKKKKYWPFVLGTAAAAIDETIQIFVPGRGPGVKDVLIDSCGVAAGMILIYLGHIYFKRKSNQILMEDK